MLAKIINPCPHCNFGSEEEDYSFGVLVYGVKNMKSPYHTTFTNNVHYLLYCV